MTPSSDACRFEALIVPHRSLSRRGLRKLGAVLTALTALIGLRVWWMGAWPVLAISVPELALILYLLRVNARRARASELVLLDGRTLRIVRTDPSGACTEVVLPAAWLSVDLREAPGRNPQLLLRNRGALEEIGRALGETERRALATALRDALHGLRNPRFNNAQLEDSSDPVP